MTLVGVFIELNLRDKLRAKFPLFLQSHLITVCDSEIYVNRYLKENIRCELWGKVGDYFSYRNKLISELDLFDLSLPMKGVWKYVCDDQALVTDLPQLCGWVKSHTEDQCQAVPHSQGTWRNTCLLRSSSPGKAYGCTNWPRADTGSRGPRKTRGSQTCLVGIMGWRISWRMPNRGMGCLRVPGARRLRWIRCLLRWV